MAKFVKKYNLKVYSQAGTYKRVISEGIRMSDISFSEDINGGQGNITIKLNLDYGDTSISPGDIVNIFVIDDMYKDGTSKYWGYIEYVNRVVSAEGEYIELSILGLFTLLSEVLYESGGVKVFTKNTDPKTIIDEIVDYFNTKYPFPGISKNTTLFGSSVNLSFDYMDCLSAIKLVQSKTDYYFFVDENATLKFKAKSASADHLVKLNHDLLLINSSQTILNTINKTYVERSGGTIVAYQDATSQTNYGLREKKDAQTSIMDVGTQNTYGAKYITDNKDPKLQTDLTISYKYLGVLGNMENIRPGDTISVMNTKYKLTNLQIQKVDYNSEFIKVYLDKYQGINDLLVLKN